MDSNLEEKPRFICFSYEKGIFEVTQNHFMHHFVEGYFAYDRYDASSRWGYTFDDQWNDLPEIMIPPELRAYVLVAA